GDGWIAWHAAPQARVRSRGWLASHRAGHLGDSPPRCDPVVPLARGGRIGPAPWALRRLRRAPCRRHDPPRRGQAACPAARAGRSDRGCRRAAGCIRRDHSYRRDGLGPFTGATTCDRVTVLSVRCFLLPVLGFVAACSSEGSATKPQGKGTDPERKLA